MVAAGRAISWTCCSCLPFTGGTAGIPVSREEMPSVASTCCPAPFAEEGGRAFVRILRRSHWQGRGGLESRFHLARFGCASHRGVNACSMGCPGAEPTLVRAVAPSLPPGLALRGERRGGGEGVGERGHSYRCGYRSSSDCRGPLCPGVAAKESPCSSWCGVTMLGVGWSVLWSDQPGEGRLDPPPRSR